MSLGYIAATLVVVTLVSLAYSGLKSTGVDGSERPAAQSVSGSYTGAGNQSGSLLVPTGLGCEPASSMIETRYHDLNATFESCVEAYAAFSPTFKCGALYYEGKSEDSLRSIRGCTAVASLLRTSHVCEPGGVAKGPCVVSSFVSFMGEKVPLTGRNGDTAGLIEVGPKLVMGPKDCAFLGASGLPSARDTDAFLRSTISGVSICTHLFRDM
jgi:hypothetical protein